MGPSSDIFLPAGSQHQRSLPLRGPRSRLNSLAPRTNELAAEHRSRFARPEPVPAVPDLPVHGREASVSSNSSGSSMDRHSLASSSTSAHQSGTNRASPTSLPPSLPTHDFHPRLAPLRMLTQTRVIMHDPFANTCADALFGSPSISPPYRGCAPVEPPPGGFPSPQRRLPEFESLLPPLTPANWIGPNAPGRRSQQASPVTASGVVPGRPGHVDPRSPPPSPPRGEARSQRRAKAAKKGNRRGNLSKQATHILSTWFFDHVAHPYPSEEEKHMLMQQARLELSQVSGWGAREVRHASANRACR